MASGARGLAGCIALALGLHAGGILAEADAGWPLHGRTPDEQRFSPLAQITPANVTALGLAWSYRTGTTRGLESTPIVVDGVLYATASWSIAVALDAASGRELWRYDPRVPRWKGRNACCDVVNRGVAVSNGRVYLGTLDGRLVALDARSGEPVWEVLTVDPNKPYTITGAPRVVKGKVLIGNGGADLGVRGYFSAYDAETGALAWRFYTVPASFEGPHEHPELEVAARTWSPDSMWESGLGGTVWDSFAYDPALDLLYVGVGNSSVYDRSKRSPGGGDNLFLASILAVRPDTGRLVWHYQTTPAETWDYTAVQQMILADLEIGGRVRKVLMQAPKNGFFYVLDRESGELLAADPYVEVSWASHVDLATGRPVERPEAVWSEKRAFVTPAPPGGHNWHPMSFSPRTGLVYVPVFRATYLFIPDPVFEFIPNAWNVSEDWGALAAEMEDLYDLLAFCDPSGIVAWDPVARREAWRVDHTSPVPGGLLATASDLLFQGNGSGRFSAYDARSGERLWGVEAGIGIMAPPVTYRVDDVQYVAVLAGVGGSHGGHFDRLDYVNEGRILAFALGGDAAMPPVRRRPPLRVEMPRPDPDVPLERGRALYGRHCARCHGIGAKSSGLRPDLRFASRAVHDGWNDIVLGGLRQAEGMASFADLIDADESLAIRHYVTARAHHQPGLLERALTLAKTWGACVPAHWLAD